MIPTGGYAGAVTRLMAYIVDVIAVSALFTAGTTAVKFLIAIITGVDFDLSVERHVGGTALAVWSFVYFAGAWAVTGRTIGMALLGLRVVRPDGTKASAASAAIRALTFPLSVALFGLGFLGILFHTQRRALHDLIAGTAVVYSPAQATSLPAGIDGEPSWQTNQAPVVADV